MEAEPQRGDGPGASPAPTGQVMRGGEHPGGSLWQEMCPPYRHITAQNRLQSSDCATNPGASRRLHFLTLPRRWTTQDLPHLSLERSICLVLSLLPGRKFHSGSCFPHLPIFVRKFRSNRFSGVCSVPGKAIYVYNVSGEPHHCPAGWGGQD